MVFLEALRQFQFALGRENIIFIHCSLVPVLGTQAEQKTKPTQHTVKELRSVGIAPDVIVCRSQTPLSESTKLKISGFCQVPPANVLAVHDVSNIYHVPLILAEQNVADIIRRQLKLDGSMLPAPQLDSWRMLASRVDHASKCAEEHAESKGAKGRAPAKIAIVGKYTDLQDAYLSIVHALRHSAMQLADDIDLELLWVEASDLEPQAEEMKRGVAWGKLQECKGILLPGGFGNRGIEGKLENIRT
jgi:CTP synthase